MNIKNFCFNLQKKVFKENQSVIINVSEMVEEESYKLPANNTLQHV